MLKCFDVDKLPAVPNLTPTQRKRKASSIEPSLSIRTLRCRIKDKHLVECLAKARAVNTVWNYAQDLALKVLDREHHFLSAYDIAEYTAGATKGDEGLPLHSQTVQAVTEQYVNSRCQSSKRRLSWRTSFGKRRSFGWIPVKASAVRYRNGQLGLSGFDKPLSLWV